MRYAIIKPVDADWDEFGTLLRELSYQTRQILNESIRLAWEWQGFSADYKEQYNKYPNPRETLGYAGIDGYIYDKFKSKYTHLYSANLSQTVRAATDSWKNSLKDMLRGDKSILSYKKDQPIHLHNKSIVIHKIEHAYHLTLNLISNEYKKELERKNTTYTVLIKATDNTQRAILERLLSGEYKISASMILKRKNKWFVNLAYKFEYEPKNNLSPTNIMGIDMGVVYPVYMAFNNSFSRYKIEGGEIDEYRRRVENRRIQILNQRKYCGEGSIGHGRATRNRPIDTMSDKVANFRDTTNHKYSRYVVDMAVKHGCGVIQMEDLSGISKDNIFLKNWSYYDLQTKIQYKAKEAGIEVRLIKPAYTSQRCSKCGYIDKENREDQKTFVCKECGFQTNADYNAARNIATDGIEQIIADTLAKHLIK